MKRAAALVLLFLFSFPVFARAEYVDRLRQQARETGARFTDNTELVYFRDIGVVIGKADGAELYDLLMEISREANKKMDMYIEARFKKIEDLLERDPFSAGPVFQEILKFEKYYEPSKDFLSTAPGKAMAAEIARLRQESITRLAKDMVVTENLIKGFQAYRKTGFFMTGTPQEEKDLQDLSARLSCGLSWARKISYKSSQNFKSEYEKGSLVETAELTLQTPGTDLLKAEWRGPWTVSFKGRDGMATAASEATLKVQRGSYTGDLVITPAKLSSTGRFNFPISLAGEQRTVTVQGGGIQPKVKISEEIMPLSGCASGAFAEAPEVKNKNGKVLLS